MRESGSADGHRDGVAGADHGRAGRGRGERAGVADAASPAEPAAKRPPRRQRNPIQHVHFSELHHPMNDQILSQDEVDALLQGITGESQTQLARGRRPRAASAATTWSSQERIVRGRMPALGDHQRALRHATSALGLFSFIRKSPEVSIGPITGAASTAPSCARSSVPTNFNIVSVRAAARPGLVVCDPTLVFARDRRALRRRRQVPRRASRGATSRPPSSASSARLVDVVMADYKRAWDGIYPLELEYQRSEMQPQFANIATPGGDRRLDLVHARRSARPAARSTSAFRTRRSEPIRDVLYSTHARRLERRPTGAGST